MITFDSILPIKTALLIIDMQNEFLVEGAPLETPRARMVLSRLRKLIDDCRRAGVVIIYTNHMHKVNGTDMGMMGKIWKIVRDGIVNVPGTVGTRIHGEIYPTSQDIVLIKNRYSAFFGTKLEEILRDHDIETVVITGVLSNGCCAATAFDALYRDYQVIWLSDCCETFDIPAYGGGTIPAEIVNQVIQSTIATWYGEVMDSFTLYKRLNI